MGQLRLGRSSALGNRSAGSGLARVSSTDGSVCVCTDQTGATAAVPLRGEASPSPGPGPSSGQCPEEPLLFPDFKDREMVITEICIRPKSEHVEETGSALAHSCSLLGKFAFLYFYNHVTS